MFGYLYKSCNFLLLFTITIYKSLLPQGKQKSSNYILLCLLNVVFLFYLMLLTAMLLTLFFICNIRIWTISLKLIFTMRIIHSSEIIDIEEFLSKKGIIYIVGLSVFVSMFSLYRIFLVLFSYKFFYKLFCRYYF